MRDMKKSIMQIKITTLVDNQAARGDDSLIHEHGLAMVIQTAHESILFDTGYSDAVLKNARQLGIDAGRIRKVIISHGHLDHAGGVKYLIDSNPDFTLMAHPGIFAKKIIRSSGTSRTFGISEDLPALKNKGIRLDLQEHAIVISENIRTDTINYYHFFGYCLCKRLLVYDQGVGNAGDRLWFFYKSVTGCFH